MSRKSKPIRGRIGLDDDTNGKADYRAAVFTDKQGDKDRPAELFRMDLVSAMKLSDSEYVDREDYFEITDQWREEWQRPVQVPVNPHEIPQVKIEPVHLSLALHSQSFSLPRDKWLHFKADERYDALIHHLTQQLVAEDANTCKYDADEQDQAWLRLFNVKMVECGLRPLEINTFERFIEAWEIECFQNISKKLGSSHTGDEDDIVCDVCFSLESEEDNEMIFCDRCDICVHQACYGVSKIPDGAWLCRPCSLGLQPTCCLCNKKCGALKPTKSGSRWAHVNCAIWVPEVSFGDPDKMEPIMNISKIPESRWSLVCSLCKQSNGAAIQCAVGACKTAFHVTCAFEANLEMQELLSQDGADVTLKAYCRKHSAQIRGEQPNKGNQIEPVKGRSTQASREASRSALASGINSKTSKAEEAEANFYLLTSGVDAIADRLLVPTIIGDWVFAYWKMKRRSLGNRPLLPAVRACVVDKERLPHMVDNPILAALRRFIILRQDLERARNLCYLVVRREKQKRSLLRTEQDLYDKLSDLETSTSWKSILMDNADKLPAGVGSPSVQDLRLIFGCDSLYGAGNAVSTLSEEKEAKIMTTEDKKIIEQNRKKFNDLIKQAQAKATETSTPGQKGATLKVNRVVSTEQSPSKQQMGAASSSLNPKLNKIRLRLAKSPSARTAQIVSPRKGLTEPPFEQSPVKVSSAKPKVEKLKLRLSKSRDEAPSTSRDNLFDRIKDEYEFPGSPSPSSSTATRGRKRGIGRRIDERPLQRSELPASSGRRGGKSRGRGAKGSGGGKSSASMEAVALPSAAKHRRIKVPTYEEDEEPTSDNSTSSSSSEEVTDSDAESSSSDISPVNPRQIRNRQSQRPPDSDDETSEETSEESSSVESGSESENSSSDDGSIDNSGSSDSDSDFVKTPPKRVRQR